MISVMTNVSSSSQRALIAIYESIQDLVPEPSPADWEGWVRMGRQEQNKNTLIYKRNLQ